MIQPSATGRKKPRNNKGFVLYCILGVILCLTNFAPVYEAHVNDSKHRPLRNSLKYWFLISFIVSLPLWLEVCIDLFVKHFPASPNAKKTGKRRFDYTFGHSVLLVSLTLPFYLYFAHSEKRSNLLFAECFIAACRTLALIVIFGKLHIFSVGHWNFCNSIPMIVVIVVVELLNSFGLARCGMEAHCIIQWHFSPQIFMALCIVLNTIFARQYFYELYKVCFTKDGTTYFNTNRYASLSLVLIVQMYLVVRFIMAFVAESIDADRNHALVFKVIVLIVLATLAAVLPGRMVRQMLITMKNEMAHKETFVRYISHEIRSPLSTTTLGLDYLIKTLTSDEPLEKTSILDIVRDARYAADTATNTLNDLLMYDKIESGMADLATTKCDMWEFLQHCVKPFSIQASSADVALNVLLEVDLHTKEASSRDIESQQRQQQQITDDDTKVSAIMVHIDKYKMEQVVRNFMTNALKFTPSGGSITVNVTLQSEYSQPIQKSVDRDVDTVESDHIVRVEVVDTGPGISETNLPKLFSQYVQFDANTLQGGKGSGLGLWLSKAIVEMHGGVIGATSEGAGRGCTFFLELPVVELCVDDDDEEWPRGSLHRKPTNLTSFNTYGTECRNTETIDNEHTQQSSALSFPPPDVQKDGSQQAVPQRTDTTTVDRPHYSASSSKNSSLLLKSNTVLKGKRTAIAAAITKRAKVYQSLVESEPVQDHSRSLRVLIVDDSLIARKMVTRTLSALEGCVCEHASNGKEAVDKVMASQSAHSEGEQPFDVILMDFYMPVMNGPDAVRTLRSPQCHYKGLILAVTGVSVESEFDSLLEAGLIDHILVKPFDLAVFKRVVRAKSIRNNPAICDGELNVLTEL